MWDERLEPFQFLPDPIKPADSLVKDIIVSSEGSKAYVRVQATFQVLEPKLWPDISTQFKFLKEEQSALTVRVFPLPGAHTVIN
jgi:hypothetical protein